MDNKTIEETDMQKTIFILGMHRSGTSALTGVLSKLGAPLPKTPMAAGSDNPKGFFESYAVMSLSDLILSENGSSWDDWRAFSPPSDPHLTSHAYDDRINAVLVDEYADNSLITVKDPRICRMAPYWISAVRAAGREPLALIPCRHPFEVAQSLNTRNRMSLGKALLLWLRHSLDAEFYSRNVKRHFVTMDALLDDWRGCLTEIGDELGLIWPDGDTNWEQAIEEFLDGSLRHHRVDESIFANEPILSGWVKTAHEALLGLSSGNDPEAHMKRLDLLRQTLDDATVLFWPAMHAAEQGLVKAQKAQMAAEAELGTKTADLQHALLGEQDLMKAHLENYHIAMNDIKLAQAQEREAWVRHLEAETRARNENHARAMDELTRRHGQDHDAWIAHVERVSNDHKNAIAALNDRHATEKNTLQQQLIELQRAYSEATGIHEANTLALVELHNNTVANIVRLSGEQRDALEQAHTLSLTNAADIHAEERGALLAKLDETAQALEETQARDFSQIQDLQTRLKNAESGRDDLTARLANYDRANALTYLVWALSRQRRP